MRSAIHSQPQPQVTEPHRISTVWHGFDHDLHPYAIDSLGRLFPAIQETITTTCTRSAVQDQLLVQQQFHTYQNEF
jgi:hypothetical protein